MHDSDKYFMKCAIFLAKISEMIGEVPVGAVLVFNNTIIGKGLNSSILNHDPTAHAEIKALRNGAKFLKNYRLLHTTLYVTLEPCIMCYGAIIHSRISRLVFGAKYKNLQKYICCKNHFFINKNFRKISITQEVLESECSNLLSSFFKRKRKIATKYFNNNII
ncbi:putative deaminase [Buchnera aphidicola str. Bp (Baizongia pistaciae)]|uniref:tRNA-specific adenosine deaminase n=1 Tax=Buchnera aphidicola subsp. Baizongia pistaciae (strain Bp) TaxID=224915 RepID=TADA_BUCBP|nr:tRNA adenosine(34) deaminase TadA [Buchnera aphidicola]Q89AM8.1 RecName: Full=tRNA-specific adenosine deaminase [Buchnera aphidicola str. Bp (Baizongia pistaciae)]AAO26963.1 putative deaminase [Buchnera aphidicola str. Bp (Baizongia pistaciae)]